MIFISLHRTETFLKTFLAELLGFVEYKMSGGKKDQH